jgi:hypothetical protein
MVQINGNRIAANLSDTSLEAPKSVFEARVFRVQGWLDRYLWQDSTTKEELVNDLLAEETARVGHITSHRVTGSDTLQGDLAIFFMTSAIRQFLRSQTSRFEHAQFARLYATPPAEGKLYWGPTRQHS